MPRQSLIIIALLILSSPASYGQAGACADEIARYCSSVPRGGGRVRACLKKHEADLSAGCKQQIGAASKRIDACRADIEKHCTNSQPGPGALRACLLEHRDELSRDCKAQITADEKPANPS
jgi:hypothetical protein